jgi:hypothetical protein
MMTGCLVAVIIMYNGTDHFGMQFNRKTSLILPAQWTGWMPISYANIGMVQ